MASLVPDAILQTGLAFWRAKVLLSAVELGLFTVLAAGPRTGEELREALGLHPRAVRDFLDALLALGFLERDGRGRHATYRNTAETGAFLDRNGAAYVGGMLQAVNDRVYGAWERLTDTLKTGEPATNTEGDCGPVLSQLCVHAEAITLLGERFDFGRHLTLADVGGGTGRLACTLAQRHPHLRATTLDRADVTALARRHIERCGLWPRVQAQPMDIHADSFPRADVITLGGLLHRWSLERKLVQMRKAHDALPDGGCLIAIDLLIDDERRRNDCGLLMSLNMLVEGGEGFDYSGADFASWARSLDFSWTEVIPLAGPVAAAVAYK